MTQINFITKTTA